MEDAGCYTAMHRFSRFSRSIHPYKRDCWVALFLFGHSQMASIWHKADISAVEVFFPFFFLVPDVYFFFFFFPPRLTYPSRKVWLITSWDCTAQTLVSYQL